MNSMNRVSAGAALFGVTKVVVPADMATVVVPATTWALPVFESTGLSELEVLRKLVGLLKANLRKPDPDDGVMPPKISTRIRSKRIRVDSLVLESREPEMQEQIHLRIAAVLLVQYDGRMTRHNACKCLYHAYGVLWWRTLENTLQHYATHAEQDYKPYKPGLRVTYRQVIEDMKPQNIALADEALFLPGQYAVMADEHQFRCVRFAEHPHWEVDLKYVRYTKQKCPTCREQRLLR